MRIIIILYSNAIMTDQTTAQPQFITQPSDDAPQLALMTHRPRRLRGNATLRRMVSETHLTAADLIYPLFVMEGENQAIEIPSMPGQYRYTLDLLLKEIQEAWDLGIGAIALFPKVNDALKDNAGTESFNQIGRASCRERV